MEQLQSVTTFPQPFPVIPSPGSHELNTFTQCLPGHWETTLLPAPLLDDLDVVVGNRILSLRAPAAKILLCLL